MGFPSGGGGAPASWTDDGTVTVSGGGSLAYDTNYNDYYIDGKVLYWKVEIAQTTAGTGTSDLEFTPPNGVTVVDNRCAGVCSSFDLSNGNTYQTHGVEAINSSNSFKIRSDGTGLYIRGNAMIGNANTNTLSLVIVCEIS